MKKINNAWLLYGILLVVWGLWIMYDELKKLPITSPEEECKECEEKEVLPVQEGEKEDV